MVKHIYPFLILFCFALNVFSQEAKILTKFSQDGTIFEASDKSSAAIAEFKENQKCIVTDYMGRYTYKVKYNNVVGYVQDQNLQVTEKMMDLYFDHEEKQREKAIQEREERQRKVADIAKKATGEDPQILQKQKDSILKVNAEKEALAKARLEAEALAKKQKEETAAKAEAERYKVIARAKAEEDRLRIAKEKQEALTKARAEAQALEQKRQAAAAKAAAEKELELKKKNEAIAKAKAKEEQLRIAKAEQDALAKAKAEAQALEQKRQAAGAKAAAEKELELKKKNKAIAKAKAKEEQLRIAKAEQEALAKAKAEAQAFEEKRQAEVAKAEAKKKQERKKKNKASAKDKVEERKQLAEKRRYDSIVSVRENEAKQLKALKRQNDSIAKLIEEERKELEALRKSAAASNQNTASTPDPEEVKKRALLERMKYRDSCHYQINEYDKFYNITTIRTEPYKLSSNLTVELYKQGRKTNVFFNFDEDLGCASYLPSQRSSVKVTLQNDRVIKFYHSWDIECGEAFLFKAVLTKAHIANLKMSPIKSIELNGTQDSKAINYIEYKGFFRDKLKCIE